MTNQQIAIDDAERAFKASAPQAALADLVMLDKIADDVVRFAHNVTTTARLIEGQNARPTEAFVAMRVLDALDDALSAEAFAVVSAAVHAAVMA